MAIRYLLIAIDDEQPLGPQVRALRAVLPWKLIRRLIGKAPSRRWLHELAQGDVHDGHTFETLEWGELPATVGAELKTPVEALGRPIAGQLPRAGVQGNKAREGANNLA